MVTQPRKLSDFEPEELNEIVVKDHARALYHMMTKAARKWKEAGRYEKSHAFTTAAHMIEKHFDL